MYFVVTGGMGNAFNPPGDAEHVYHVAEIGIGGRENGSLALRYALTLDYMPVELKTVIRDKLKAHQGECTEEWVKECYAHFKHCYSPDGVQQNVGECTVCEGGNPEHHLGYLHVRSFFPDHKARIDLM